MEHSTFSSSTDPSSLADYIQRAKLEWEATADSLPHLVSLIDQAGRVLRINRTLERWNLGRVTTARGCFIHELLHPNCLDHNCYLVQFLERAMDRKVPLRSHEIQMRDEWLGRDLHYQMQPFQTSHFERAESEDDFFTLVISDVTRRVQMEGALQRALQESDQRNAEVLALLQANRLILKSADFEDTVQSIFQITHSLIGASGLYVYLEDRPGDVLYLDGTTVQHISSQQLPSILLDLYHESSAKGGTSFDNAAQPHNLMVAALEFGSLPVGAMAFADRPGGFDLDRARLGTAFAELAAIALQNSRALQARRQAEQALRWDASVNLALTELSHILISPALSVPEVARTILKYARWLTGSEHGFVSSINPKSGEIIAHTMTEMYAKGCQISGQTPRVPFTVGKQASGQYPFLWGYALNVGQSFYTNHPELHPAHSGPPEGHVPLRNFLAAPAIVADHPLGLIALANSDHEYTDKDEYVTQRLADLYALAIQRRQMEDDLREKSADLAKRVNEQSCLYEISHLLQNLELTPQALYRQIVDRIPGGYQHPEIAYARLLIDQEVYQTENFRQTAWMQASPVQVKGQIRGVVEAGYLEAPPPAAGAASSGAADSPFLQEERSLLDAIAQMLGQYLKHRSTQQMLHENQEYYQSIYQNLPLGYMCVDADSRLLDVNDTWLDMFGYLRDEILGFQFGDLMSPERAESFRQHFERFKVVGYVHSIEFEMRCKDRAPIAVMLNGRAIYDDQGRFTRALFVVHDMTERREAEEKIRFQATLLDAVGQAVVAHDMQCKVLYWNHMAEALYGWSAEETIGNDLKSFVVPADTEEAAQTALQMLVVGEPWHGEARIRRRDGTVVPIIVNCTPVNDPSGSQIGVVAVANDLSERVRLEETLRHTNQALLALNTIAASTGQPYDLYIMLRGYLEKSLEVMEMDGGWVMLVEDNRPMLVACLGASDETQSYLRERLANPDLSKGPVVVQQLVFISDAVNAEDLDAEVTRTERRQCVLRVPIRTKEAVVGEMSLFSRRARTFDDQVAQIMDAIGRQLGLMLDNMRLAAEASEVDILREVNHLRAELLANVSHELRTPLGLIKIYVTTLLRTDIHFDPATVYYFLKNIDEETDRLEEIVASLLDMSRLEAGGLAQDKTPVDLVELVKEVARGMENQSAIHHFVYQLPEHPVMMRIAPANIGQVVRNLLMNAIKYSPQGGEITTRLQPDPTGVILSVSDQGIGIPSDQVEKIFNGFYRVDNEVTRRVRGAGLGLAVCRKVIEAHGGRIWVESEPDRGSTFICSLPALQLEDDQANGA